MKEIVAIFFFLGALALPCLSFAQTSTSSSIIPNNILDSFKKNLTFPINSTTNIKLPTPENALQEASPKLQKVNTDVKNETGIDLAKFIGWSAKVITLFFMTIVDLLQNVSKALNGSGSN